MRSGFEIRWDLTEAPVATSFPRKIPGNEAAARLGLLGRILPLTFLGDAHGIKANLGKYGLFSKSEKQKKK